jgi:heat shock protein HslJ
VSALADTAWTVVAYSDAKAGLARVLAGTVLTAVFNPDGRISGSGGCNSYTGTYRETALSISIGPVASTRKFCSKPDGVMAQEAAFFASLTAASTYTTDGAKLKLRTETGATAVELELQRP